VTRYDPTGIPGSEDETIQPLGTDAQMVPDSLRLVPARNDDRLRPMARMLLLDTGHPLLIMFRERRR
jgi:hypothetical protein